MKKIIITLFVYSSFSFAQELALPQLKDTSLFLVQLYAPEIIFDQTIQFAPLSFEFNQPLSNYYFQSSGTSQAPLCWNLQDNNIDIAQPWKLQLAHDNENKTWNMVFGSVGTGGALYIAYRHVKKYGFW